MSEKLRFNDGWEFSRQKLKTNQAPDMNIHTPVTWQPVDIPHDWLIYDTRNLYENSEGWYRKFFNYHKTNEGERLAVRFEGVYMDSTVFVNNKVAGIWKNGYSTFEFDITELAQEGKNEIKVRVIYQAPNSRWYTGAGIYRNVWLIKSSAIHIISDGIYISTSPVKDGWQVTVDTEYTAPVSAHAGKKKLILQHYLLDPAGNCPVSSGNKLKPAEKILRDNQTLMLEHPLLWETDFPHLYTLHTKLLADGEVIDAETQIFGFRTIRFDSQLGFILNERRIKLHGVCQHHDLGCLGAAVNKTALARQIHLLKKMGVNAIRTAHNMPAVELMELADEMGILICSESFDMWEQAKTEYDYARFFKDWHAKDIASWVRRDRNHPSLIMWSIGNEIADLHTSPRGQALTERLSGLVNKYDYRNNACVTLASNYYLAAAARKCADKVKLAGYNYGEKYYAEHHQKHPDWIIYGSETGAITQSRGIYHFPASQSVLADDDGQCSSLGNSTTSWGAKSVETCITGDRDIAFSAGQFIWSGFDYIGEPTPYHTKNSYFGQLDTCGFPKDSYFIYQAGWTDYKTHPMVHIFPHWDFNPEQMIDIRVCSNAPEIELFFNSQSLGKINLNNTAGKKIIGDWRLPFHPGTLIARAYDEHGNVIASACRKSFDEATQLVLSPDKPALIADARDLIFLEISARDNAGNPVENANNRITIKVSGAGRLIGIDNGDSTDYDQYKGISKRLFSGKLLAVIAAKKQSGNILVEATSPGLPVAEIVLQATECPLPEGLSAMEENTGNIPTPEIPVRKIELTKTEKEQADTPHFKINARLLPPEATYREVEWRVTDNAGIDSYIADMTADNTHALVTARGDGSFQIRCMTKNGSEDISLLSQLQFEVCGLGKKFLNPYNFVSAGLYTESTCKITNGNERGIATPREQEAQIGFQGVDFGAYGSDEITIPLFVLDSDPFPFQIWEGQPGKKGSEMLADVIYHKPSRWNTYQQDTYNLKRRLQGITDLWFVTTRKAHIKGFIFKYKQKAYQPLSAGACDHIYGDSYTVTNDSVTGIGNNVTLEFKDMDFGVTGPAWIIICGRTDLANNPIRIQFEGKNSEIVCLADFPESKDFSERKYRIEKVKGNQKVSFIFMPGSRFDFKWFRFLPHQEKYPFPAEPPAS